MATPLTMASQSATNHEGLLVEKLHVLQSVENEPSNLRISRSFSSSMASSQCCSSKILNQNDTVEMSAYCPTYDPNTINLYCEGYLVEEFSFSSDTILGIQLVSLELFGRPVIGREKSQMAGVVLIVATLQKGLSTYSILIEKKEDSETFLSMECLVVPSSDGIEFTNRRIRTITASLVYVNDDDETIPSLLVAASSSSEAKTSSDQRVDIIRIELPQHKLLTPASDVVPPSRADGHMIVEDIGRVTAMTFGAVTAEPQSFSSLAVMTSTQLTLIQVSLASGSLSLHHSAKLLLSGCQASHTLGEASMVVPLGGKSSKHDDDATAESFAIVSYTPVTISRLQETESASDEIAHETFALARNGLFSPTQTGQQQTTSSLIQELSTSKPASDALIQDTIPTTVKRFQQDSHLDDAIRIEAEASKVTPEKTSVKILDVLKERRIEFVSRDPDPSESILSPLMGLPLTDGNDESALMTSLLHIQAETPRLNTRSSTRDDAASHVILVQVEYVGEDSQVKLYPVTFSLPEEMAGLDVLSIKSLTELPVEELAKSPAPNGHGHMTCDDLMFSPSPGKLMSPPISSSGSFDIPQLSIVCKSADSRELYCFVLSTQRGNKLRVDSRASVDLDEMLSDSLDAPIKTLTMKGLTVDDAIIKSNGGRIACCNRIRIVLSTDPKATNESDAPRPINLSLQEDGTVFVATLSCSFPLGVENDTNKALETPDGRVVSSTTDVATDATLLQAILEKLSSFEAEVYRRIDRMETAVRANTDRLEEIEDALLKRNSHHDQASF